MRARGRCCTAFIYIVARLTVRVESVATATEADCGISDVIQRTAVGAGQIAHCSARAGDLGTIDAVGGEPVAIVTATTEGSWHIDTFVLTVVSADLAFVNICACAIDSGVTR